MLILAESVNLWGPILGTLAGVVVGAALTFLVGWYQSRQATMREAAAKVAEAIAPIDDLLFDYAIVGDNDLAPSRAGSPGGSGVTGMFQRWNRTRHLLSVVAVSDPDDEVRHKAGEVRRALTLHARSADDTRQNLYAGSTESDRSQAFTRLGADLDRITALLLDLERTNIARLPGVKGKDDELARLRPDTRHSNSQETGSNT